jgi:hypothetical protein
MCSEITPIVYVVVEVRPSGDGLRLDEAPQSEWAASGGGDGRPEAGRCRWPSSEVGCAQDGAEGRESS